MALSLDAKNVNAWFGSFQALEGVNLFIPAKQITALIGPSGCGKSTFLRCLNRMHEVNPVAKVDGSITLDGRDIYATDVDPTAVRRSIGMVFQRPNPFPTMSIRDNVISGLRLTGVKNKSELDDATERSLKLAGLWNEVKHRLGAAGAGLSGGQQQRLCIARAIAVNPDVLLMDEPCSALDPASTLIIEETMAVLKEDYTIAIVTHNMQQAARSSDNTAFFSVEEQGKPGRLIETGPTKTMFTTPSHDRTEAYITGRFG